MVLAVEPPSVRCSASGSEVREGGRHKIEPKYRETLAHRKMSIEYARLVWNRYLADCTNVKIVVTLVELDALKRAASLTAIVATADAEFERAPSSPATTEDEENWTM